MAEKVESQVVESTESAEVIETVDETKNEVAVKKEESSLFLNPFESKESFNYYYTMAKYMATSDYIPDTFKNKPMNCLTALEYANRMGVSANFIMQHMSIIRGKVSFSGSACSMLVNASKRFKNVRLNFIGEPNTDSYGAYVSANYVDNGDPVKGTTVTVKMAKDEGWWKQNPKWQNMTEQMLSYRAYSFFARVYCANELGGFQTDDELVDAKAKAVQVDNPF